MNTHEETDVIVLGSGGAALCAALRPAQAGMSVRVLERTEFLGGTTAVSAGMLWIPNNHHMQETEISDSREEAIEYLVRTSGPQTTRELIEAFVDNGPRMVRWLEDTTPVRLYPIDRPDYHSELPGAKAGARALDNQPVDAAQLGEVAGLIRPSHWYPEPYTYEERRRGLATQALIEDRLQKNVWCFGRALVGGLVRACRDAGVEFGLQRRATRLIKEDDRVTGVVTEAPDGSTVTYRASRAVVVATGGFEWNEELKTHFLRGPDLGPMSPPYNEGDGLLMGMDIGAAVRNMTSAAYHIAFQIPGETVDGRPRTRFISGERALPGSIIVNPAGQRIVNEAGSYSDMAAAFQAFDPDALGFPDLTSFMVFDERFRRSYSFATLKPDQDKTPDWVHTGDTLEALAARAGIDAEGLTRYVERFNRFAATGVDEDFHRGESRHDRHYGDAQHGPNPCLGPLTQAPFYAIPVIVGTLGTRGGLQTDTRGRVLNTFGTPITGLYACSNTMAAVTGSGYPGAGGTLGPNLTSGYVAGGDIVAQQREDTA
ncbi:FAD-dependent oxidoreductase [Streptomyces sp. NPDC056716]|uniref:FAD-dependent oxidoreductase n=1 Tax=unclassified Streptomyces TaxID=2593676 RepID=UPI0036B93915